MTVLIAQEDAASTEIEMAKAAPADPVIVSHYADALSAAGKSRSAFESVLSHLKADKAVGIGDMIGIALAYRGGGARPRSKKHALELIEKRFVEILRDAKKISIASRVRPW